MRKQSPTTCGENFCQVPRKAGGLRYLAAYVLIAGPLFYGTGIPLDRDLLHPDRGVMKSLLLAGCVEIGQTRPGLFELTAKGRELIAGLDLQISDAPVGV